MTAQSQESLRLRLLAPRETIASDTVHLTLLAENATDRPLDLYLRGRTITFDIVVTRDDGTPVWRLLEGEIIPAILQLRTLAPRETIELGAEWNGTDHRGRRVAPGVYVVRGALMTDSTTPLETEPTQLRITAR